MNVVIIGYGGMGGYHRERLKSVEGYRVTGIYDIDPAREDAARQEGLTVYPSAQAVADDKTVDAVLLAVPNDVHKPYVLQFAAAKKHIICEKPAALSAEEFDDMTAAAEKAGVLLAVHQNRRWDKDYLTMRAILDSGVLGKVYRIESCVMGANGVPGGWRKQLKHGGGMMLDWGVHLLDQLVQTFPQDIESLMCTYSYALGFDVDDGFDMHLRFSGGPETVIRVDTNAYHPLPRWVVYGRDGTAVIENWDLKGHIIRPNYDNEEELVGIQAGNGFTKTMAYRSHSSVVIDPLPQVTVDVDAFYKNFLLAAAGKAPAAVPNDGVRKVMRVMEYAKQSSDEHQVIKTFRF